MNEFLKGQEAHFSLGPSVTLLHLLLSSADRSHGTLESPNHPHVQTHRVCLDLHFEVSRSYLPKNYITYIFMSSTLKYMHIYMSMYTSLKKYSN